MEPRSPALSAAPNAAIQPGAPAAPAHPLVNPWIVAISVMLATFMEVLDTTVVNVSLPHIAGSLSSSVDEATWALTSYLVANAIVLPMTGWLAGRFGRKRLLLLSVGGFTIASFLCGLAPTLPLLIFFRVVQGLTGGCLQPLSQAVLLETFPPESRGKAMAFWGLGIVVAPIIGPVLGGWLTDNTSWRWVFYINVPVGLLALLMIQLYIHDPSYLRRAKEKIDFWGLGFLALGVGALQILLDKGQEDDWFSSNLITALGVMAVLGLIAFIVRELMTSAPIVDLRALKNRTYATGVLLMTVMGFGLYGSLVMVPIFLQSLLRYPAYQAGFAMAPRGIGSFIAMPIVGLILNRVGAKRLLLAGFYLAALTLFWHGTLSLDAGYWDIFWPQFIQGVSLGLLFVPLTAAAMSPISKEKMGNATSIFNLMRNIGGSIGIATATTLLARRQQVHFSILGAHFDPFDPRAKAFLDGLKRSYMAAGADPMTAAQRASAGAIGLVQRQAAMLSFVDVFRILAWSFVIVAPLVFLMKAPKKGGEAPMVH
ncbi:MAG TPA: DHA2 family efflux MFS transporter permease subunit [Thermoanaerobaculia bacterium]|jgi:DHA2 family multidrug resistance protein|nr:DHA2 family efflux MFS transporter permease subunit [Thermoanaerobaculia bacterium]